MNVLRKLKTSVENVKLPIKIVIKMLVFHPQLIRASQLRLLTKVLNLDLKNQKIGLRNESDESDSFEAEPVTIKIKSKRIQKK